MSKQTQRFSLIRVVPNDDLLAKWKVIFVQVQARTKSGQTCTLDLPDFPTHTKAEAITFARLCGEIFSPSKVEVERQDGVTTSVWRQGAEPLFGRESA